MFDADKIFAAMPKTFEELEAHHRGDLLRRLYARDVVRDPRCQIAIGVMALAKWGARGDDR